VGAGRRLPFTGPGDLYAAFLLALFVATGGFVLMMHASVRDRALAAARRTMRSMSGFRKVDIELQQPVVGKTRRNGSKDT
jgi:hypothetical protein